MKARAPRPGSCGPIPKRPQRVLILQRDISGKPWAAMLDTDETGRALSTRRGLHYLTKHPDGAQGSTSLAQACRHVQAADSLLVMLLVQRSTRIGSGCSLPSRLRLARRRTRPVIAPPLATRVDRLEHLTKQDARKVHARHAFGASVAWAGKGWVPRARLCLRARERRVTYTHAHTHAHTHTHTHT